MTEQEIIEFLKENRLIGVAFKFIPDEVKQWVSDNYNNPKLLYLTAGGKWGFFHQTDFGDYDSIVFALFDDYELPQKHSGELVEFDIRNGFFKYLDWSFQWFDWGAFLKFIFEKKFEQNKDFDYFTAFGGWKFEDDGCWHTCPTFKCCPGEGDKPCIPVKIRFWKGEIK